jgi:hypothetical protein
MNPILTRNLGSIMRAILLLFGAQNLFDDTTIDQLAGAVALIGFAAWTIYKNRRSAPQVAQKGETEFPLTPPYRGDLRDVEPLNDVRELPDRKPFRPRGKTVR